MKGHNSNALNLNLGISATAHAVLILLCLAVIGNAAVAKRDIITIVLDAQASVTSGPHCAAALRKPAQIPPPAKSLRKPVAQEAPKVVHRKAISPQAKQVETPTNPQSEVATTVDTQASAWAEQSSPEGIAPSDGQAAGKEFIPAGNGAINGGLSVKADNIYMREHFAYIRDLVTKNLGYPHAARKFGWKGCLTVSFVICEGGHVENIRIVKSSGYKILDENAVNTIKSIQPFPRPPAKAQIVIPIEYRFG